MEYSGTVLMIPGTIILRIITLNMIRLILLLLLAAAYPPLAAQKIKTTTAPPVIMNEFRMALPILAAFHALAKFSKLSARGNHSSAKLLPAPLKLR